MKLGQVQSGQSSVGFIKISKDGKYINKFITTRSTAIQHAEDSSKLSINQKYLQRVSREREKKVYRSHMSNHRLVRRREVDELEDDKFTESVMKNVLQGLVDLLKPTEAVKFVTPLCSTSINNELIKPLNIVPAQVTDEGEVIKDAVSDLYIAIVSSSQPSVEESAVFILRQSLLETDSRLTRIVSKTNIFEDEERQPILDLHPDNPQEIQKVATKLVRKRKKNKYASKISKLEVLCLLEIEKDTRVNLKGGGKILLSSKNILISLITSSVRSMWGFYMALQKAKEVSENNYKSSGSFVERMDETHAWVAHYFDDSNTVTQSKIDVEEEFQPIENFDSSLKPTEMALMASLKKILAGFDIDDITMKDVYEGLTSIHGDSVIGPEGFTKAEIDTYTMRAVGQLEPPSEIIDNLYLGSEYNACNRAEMENLDIGLVVNVTEEVENFFEDKFTYFTISLKDVPSSELKPYFREAIQKIDETLESGKSVLVHCQRGVSRSATIVISFLMMTKNMTAEEAIKFAKSRRSIVKPNKGFKQQLKDFEEELNDA